MQGACLEQRSGDKQVMALAAPVRWNATGRPWTSARRWSLVEKPPREHPGQVDRPWTSWDDAPHCGNTQPYGGAMRRYTERYTYDKVGNFKHLKHVPANNGSSTWLRDYVYEEASC